MAKYFYQITLKQNPFDPITHYHYGILLTQMGKYELSEKRMTKARSLNKDIDFDAIEYDESVDTKCVYNECNYCGSKGYDYKKCSQCKVVFYCSRKCQKYDWIRKKHKHQCVAKDKLTVYDKVRPYLLRLSSKLYNNSD